VKAPDSPAAEESDKICPKCGAANPGHSCLCSECCEVLSNTPAGSDFNSNAAAGVKISQPGGGSPDSQKPVLLLCSDSDNIEINVKSGETIGRCDRCKNDFEKSLSECRSQNIRAGFVDCKKFNTVSRKHLMFEFEGGHYYVRIHPDAKNLTALNGNTLEKGQKYKLTNGDSIQISSKLKLAVKIVNS
jgi:hypothetical protein